MFKTTDPYSPVNTQEMVWLAEYKSGESIAEFDFENKTPNSFYEINQDEINKFGLVGGGYKMWLEKSTGEFNISERKYDVGYRVGDKTYMLTDQAEGVRDIITYKKALSEMNGGSTRPRVVAFYFGYKSEFMIDGITFNFKPIISVPVGEAMYIDMHLVVDKDLDGEIVFIKNDKIIESFEAPLEKNVSGGMQWKLI